MSEREHLSDETLNEYLDGALSTRAMAQADEHLRSCETCAHRLRLSAEVFAALDDLPEIALDKDLAPSIVETLRSRTAAGQRQGRRLTWRLGLALVAEAAGSLALLGFILPDALSGLTPAAIPGFTVAISSVLEQAAIFLSAVVATPDPLGLEALVSSFSAPSIPWASVSSLITLLAAATLVWLLGNGILLRRGPLSENRRDR
jgi:anti-sigma factor RsiW